MTLLFARSRHDSARSLRFMGLATQPPPASPARQCWVFRLHGSDLMPADSAPGLRVVDAAVVTKAIAVVRRLPVAEQIPCFAKTLHLGIDEANSCR